VEGCLTAFGRRYAAFCRSFRSRGVRLHDHRRSCSDDEAHVALHQVGDLVAARRSRMFISSTSTRGSRRRTGRVKAG